MELQRQDILAYLQQATRHDLSKLGDDAELFSSGLLDSYTLVDMWTWLDGQGFQIQPQDMTVDNLDTVTSILSLVNSTKKRRRRR
ncbi:hypothetical protein PPSIR1_05103 [Plesiocystis pacifica SIR-1]|uniref:Carrier domain-containing protein n=1 Tax=Plesiocystis pacifica SIR-1 TaxID=391625 RepID=A6FWZ3_9BACT|nr:hypothetical protein [Plesiocystis pacifica]EDM81817.1 hypothetical protein PPSIR1_05103 [Plesiocystis pacifica SIR-1]